MVDNVVAKHLGLVLIVAAHVVFNGPSQAQVTGILGTNISLQFTFNISITKTSHFAVYRPVDHKIMKGNDKRKIAEYIQGNGGSIFVVYPKNNSASYHITNLKLSDSGSYWASVFMDSGPAKESDMVELTVREELRSSTVPPVSNDITINKDRGSPGFFSSHIITVLVVSPVVLLAAVLPWLIWCLVRTKDEQQPSPQQNSNPTIQEVVEASNNVPASSLIYSVLDFPKRPSAVLDINPNDTEYAAVSYLPEKRRV